MKTLRALVFDSVFDVYRGVVGYVGAWFPERWEANPPIMLMSNNARYEIKEVGRVYAEDACAGKAQSRRWSVIFIANIKSTADIKIGRTRSPTSAIPRARRLIRFQEISSDGLSVEFTPIKHHRATFRTSEDRESGKLRPE